MTTLDRPLSKSLWVVALLALAAGLVLRIASFGWNTRLQGDVNLFALTAREFVQHDRLHYPMKYEYTDHVPYRALHTPASQHPPLWPLACGLLGKLFRTADTFFILKAMCLVAGCALLAIIGFAGIRAGWRHEALVAVSCIALSAMFVDFSANGSPYILSAMMLVLTVVLLAGFRYQTLTDYVLAGVLCGIGLQVHSAMVCMPVAFGAFWLWKRAELRWRGVVSAVVTGLVVLAPWVIWNVVHFGTPFYSHASDYLLRWLGLTQRGIYGDVITTRPAGAVDMGVLEQYAFRAAVNARAFVYRYFLEIGPFCTVLALIGCVALFKRDKHKAMALVVPCALYVIAVFLWATYRYRYLLPVLPAAYIAAGFGFVALCRRRLAWKLAGCLCFAGTLAWGAQGFFEKPRAQYYQEDEGRAAQYASMRELATELGTLEPGVTLGYAESLDAGIETVYWHEFPFVAGHGFTQAEEIRKLVSDFGVRYIWADKATVDRLKSFLPEARLILRNERYFVFEMPQQGQTAVDWHRSESRLTSPLLGKRNATEKKAACAES
jgi:hypothetical protein